MRELIIAEAREWIGTPFKLQAAKKKVGCDCIGLVVGVGKEVGLIGKGGININNFPAQQYTLRSNPNTLLDYLESFFDPIEHLENAALALMLFGHHFHLGFIAKNIKESAVTTQGIFHDDMPYNFSLIHQDISAGEVVEHKLSPELSSKIVTVYRTVRE